MDRFGVPNKVNRHVAKALKTLYRKKGSQHVVFSEILTEVKQSMRNLKPVKHLGKFVRRSIKNLENNGSSIAESKSKPFRKLFPNIVSLMICLTLTDLKSRLPTETEGRRTTRSEHKT